MDLSVKQVERIAPVRGRRKRADYTWLFTLIAIVLALIFLIPMVWLVSVALKTPVDMAAFPPVLFPTHLQWINFVDSLTWINYWQFTLNTVFLATLSGTLTTLTSAMVGFAFARLSGFGKNVLFVIMISTMMIPAIITVIPTYIIFADLGMVGTYWPWFFWGLASSPFLSFLFRQFFSGIPSELEDAAIVDGASRFRIFWQIFLPLSLPVMAVSFVMSFVGVWGDWLTPKIFLNDPNSYTLGLAMSSGYTNPSNPNVPALNVNAAGVIIYILPMVLVFFFAQRFYVRSLVSAALK